MLCEVTVLTLSELIKLVHGKSIGIDRAVDGEYYNTELLLSTYLTLILPGDRTV